MNSSIVLGQYYNSDSWFHRLDPRTKIILVLLYMVSIFLVDNIYAIFGFFALVLLIVLTTKVPFGKFLQSLKMIAFLIIFMTFFQVVFRRTGELLGSFNFKLTIWNLMIIVVLLTLYFLSNKIIRRFRFLLFILTIVLSFSIQYYFTTGLLIVNYKVNIFKDSLETALFVFLRIISILFMSSALTLTTKPTQLNIALESLLKPLKIFKINVSIFAMMMSIALRYIPTLINEANKILKAQASRGVDFKESRFKDKITQIVSLIVPMFVVAYNQALDLTDAMDARGYNPDKKRTSINILKLSSLDKVLIIFINIAFIMLIVLKIIYKF